MSYKKVIICPRCKEKNDFGTPTCLLCGYHFNYKNMPVIHSFDDEDYISTENIIENTSSQNTMSLIKCPACGRDNVSIIAESCPNCSFPIKQHFDEIEAEKKRKHDEIKKNIEERREYEERISNVQQLKMPKLGIPIVITVISVLGTLLGILLLISGWFSFFGVIISSVGLFGIWLSIKLFSASISDYKLSRDDFEEYQRKVVREQDAFDDAELKRQDLNHPKCPMCGSKNTYRIGTINRGVSVATVGLASSKIGKQYGCNSCGHKW